MPSYRITHTTTYLYSDPVSMCHNKAYLTPRDHAFQHLKKHVFEVDPKPRVSHERVDFFGNRVRYFTVQERHERLVVRVNSEVDVSSRPYPPASETTRWEIVREMLKADLSRQGLEAAEYLYDSVFIRRSAELQKYAQPSFPRGRSLMDCVMDLNARIHRDFQYAPQTTTISTPLHEVLRIRKGVCQDFAHLMIGCLRSMGLSARYISGYLRTLPPPGKPRLIGADASHAWVSVYFPEAGWLDFDPTNNSTPGGSHVTLAWGRDYNDVSPTRGVILGGGQQVISVGVDVEPVA